MGFDCSLHVVNEQLIARRFVSTLLSRSQEKSAFDDRSDAEELWNKVQAALSGNGTEKNETDLAETANLICQLAIAFCASELPYHCQRGFCLSLWPDGAVPRRFIGDPESLFGELLEVHPELKGCFPISLTGNGSAGIFVPAESLRGLLEWVERKIKRFPLSERREFRGLILVFKEAAERHMGYWEGSELPVPMQKIRPPAEHRKPDLEVAEAPAGFYLSLVGSDGSKLVFGLSEKMQTAFVDLDSWPPHFQFIEGEYSRSAARSRRGRWVTATTTEWSPNYRAFIRDTPASDKTILKQPDLRECGLSWAAFLGERVVAVMGKQSVPGPKGFPLDWQHDLPALAFIEKDNELVPAKGLPLGSDRYPAWGTACLNDGSDVFLWMGNGYELHGDTFELTFPLGAKPNHMELSTAPYGPDGFFYTSDRRPFTIQRGQKPVSHLLKLSNVMYFSQAGDDAYLIKEGTNDKEDLGKLYFPKEDYYIRLKPDLFENEDPESTWSLHWAPACGRLIGVTQESFWAVPIEKVLALPRHRAK